MDLALVLAEAGIPVSFYPMPILGATGPVTIAGSAVVNNAEFVSGAVLVQLAHPGAQVIHGGGPTAMYMNSGAYASNSPEALLLRACQGHMADFYGVPAWYGAGATTAKEPGIQSAYENALAMFMAYANGADVTFGTGLLDGSRILCLENMVVDDEIIGMVKRILQRHRGERGDAGRRPHQEDGLQRQLPVRQPHARPRARALAGQARRDGQLRRLEERRRARARPRRRRRRWPRSSRRRPRSSPPTSAPSSTRSSPPRPGRRRPSRLRSRDAAGPRPSPATRTCGSMRRRRPPVAPASRRPSPERRTCPPRESEKRARARTPTSSCAASPWSPSCCPAAASR